MLKIDIIGNSGNDLKLEVNGHPNNGYSEAKQNWPVQWEIQDGSGVASIEAISMKSCTGNTNIFPSHQPPRSLGPDKKRWGAIVRPDAPIDGKYQYNIHWKKVGEETPRIYDPIIAIKPTVPSPPLPWILAIITAIIAFFAVSLLFKTKKKKR